MDQVSQGEYFLQVVKEGEKVEWPRPEEELAIGSQKLEGDYIQYWAYPKESGRNPDDLPPAESLASKNPASYPAILVSKGEGTEGKSEYFLELILIKDNHAWGKTESSLSNLEDNLTSILDFGREKFNLKVEHFMTTDKVPEEVEKKLDEIETGTSPQAGTEEEESKIKPVGAFDSNHFPSSGIYVSSKSSKIWTIIPLFLILLIFLGVVLFKDQTFAQFKTLKVAIQGRIFAPPPAGPANGAGGLTPTITPSPTPSVDRRSFKIRVLNGTPKVGAAATLKTKLEEKGWQVIAFGNATSSATPQTYVRGKEGLLEAVRVLISDLAGQFETTNSLDLKSSDKADLEVVIGKK